MTIEIEIVLRNMNVEIQNEFLRNLKNQINTIHNNMSYNNICNAIQIVLDKKNNTGYFHSTKRVCKDNYNNECNICLSKYKYNQNISKLCCNHEFHHKCINKWIEKYNNTTCPICRTSLKICE